MDDRGRQRVCALLVASALLMSACQPTGSTGGGGDAGGGDAGGGGGGGSTFSFVPPTAPAGEFELPQLIGRLEQVRSAVSDATVRAYEEVAERGYEGPPTASLKKGYLDVRGDVNAWIQEYQTAIELGYPVEDTYPHLEAALQGADEYLSWTEEWHAYNVAQASGGTSGGTSSGAMGAPADAAKAVIKFAVELLPDLTETGISLWNAAKDADEERQDEIIGVLENAKWPEWGHLNEP
jgi:hypothetical protein